MMPQILRSALGRARPRASGASPGPGCARGPLQIDISHLLGRRPVDLDTPELQRFLAGKRVLVTGAGGSIGSEICRQAMRFCPAQLLMIDRAEPALFEIDRELRERWVGSDLVPAVADVCDATRVRRLFEAHEPHVIFHAAAHKHVPMMEHNAGEAIKNNVFGTRIVADAAAASGASAFVLISTDKAVNPTSVMGATKRVAELYVQSLNVSGQWSVVGGQSCQIPAADRDHSQSSTRFLAVRFGNVLGSSGSVVPIFQRQIDGGGPVTVTHPDMKRYFMTIPEASQLVMQAGAIGLGGEIFVLDMGEPVRILDLALQMIRKSGLRPHKDIAVHYTGVRPGEKLFEELAGDDEEQTSATGHRRIRVWKLSPAPRQKVVRALELLADVIDAPREQVLFALAQCVPEFRPASAVRETEPADPTTADAQSAPTLRLVRDELRDLPSVINPAREAAA